ncbi:MAG: hypothetical protein AB8B86_17295 [Pseudomonadales bacterium]
MSEQKIWLLRLVIPGRFGKLITGILLLCLLLPLFYLGTQAYPSETTPTLFFSLVIAYIIPAFSHITTRTAEALQRLKPQLDIDDDAFERLRVQLYSGNPRLAAFNFCFGMLGGLVHMSLISGSFTAALARLIPKSPGFASMLGALLVWIVMTSVISMLIQQARIFSRLGRYHVRVSLFSTHNLLPFGGVSISSSLAILGALTLFPLIGLEGGSDMKEIVPGAVATLIPLVVIFFMPVWPVHQRLASIKAQQLVSINDQIDQYLAQKGSAEEAALNLNPQFTTMLAYRREIADSPTWPFDVSNVAKLTLYLVIPPLTWVAAALMENLVDSVL